ncbi:hypothetical protein, partial [Mesorhizobium sp.]|uniref:hypothetical protein n=1 Tax=Mesorhizobium sp. TaxID=1871066 RepID=UPI0025BC0B66
MAGRKQRNGPAWPQVPFEGLTAAREAARIPFKIWLADHKAARILFKIWAADRKTVRRGARSARFLGDQRQRAIGLHAGGNHL